MESIGRRCFCSRRIDHVGGDLRFDGVWLHLGISSLGLRRFFLFVRSNHRHHSSRSLLQTTIPSRWSLSRSLFDPDDSDGPKDASLRSGRSSRWSVDGLECRQSLVAIVLYLQSEVHGQSLCDHDVNVILRVDRSHLHLDRRNRRSNLDLDVYLQHDGQSSSHSSIGLLLVGADRTKQKTPIEFIDKEQQTFLFFSFVFWSIEKDSSINKKNWGDQWMFDRF